MHEMGANPASEIAQVCNFSMPSTTAEYNHAVNAVLHLAQMRVIAVLAATSMAPYSPVVPIDSYYNFDPTNEKAFAKSLPT
jgi:hypothetical protein